MLRTLSGLLLCATLMVVGTVQTIAQSGTSAVAGGAQTTTSGKAVKKKPLPPKGAGDMQKKEPMGRPSAGAKSADTTTPLPSKSPAVSRRMKAIDKVVGKDSQGRTIYQGERGGRYYKDRNGEKIYIEPEVDK